MVAAADMLAVVPGVTTGALDPPLEAYPLPVPTPPIPAVLAWHARYDNDAAHRWLRETITSAITA